MTNMFLSQHIRNTINLLFLIAIILSSINCSKQSPSEVLKTAYMTANEGRYEETEKHFSSAFLALQKAWEKSTKENWKLEWDASIKGMWEAITRNRTVKRIEIQKEEIKDDVAIIFFTLHFEDGSTEKMLELLPKEAGGWRIQFTDVMQAIGEITDVSQKSLPPALLIVLQISRLGDMGAKAAPASPILATYLMLSSEVILDKNGSSVSSSVSEEASKALVKIGSYAVKPLINVLNYPDFGARLEALKALGEIQDPRAVSPILSVLKNDIEVVAVRQASVLALSNIGKPAIEPLIAALDDENWRVRMCASEALVKITGKYFGYENSEKWREWWEKNK